MPTELDMIADLIKDVAILQEEVERLQKELEEIQAEIGCLPSFEFKPKRE